MRIFALALLLAASPVAAQTVSPDLRAEIADADFGSRELRAFYRQRGNLPLWVEGGQVGAQAEALFRLIETAELDGLDPDDYRPRALASALDRAEGGDPRALARAEVLLTRSWLQLARDMRAPRDAGVHYPDPELAPRPVTVRELLAEAAAVPDFAAWVRDIGWTNPVYASLRKAATEYRGVLDGDDLADSDSTRLIRRSLDRARAIPAEPGRRFVLVDAAAARLWMYEGGRPVGSMRVVVGKPSEPTPLMAGLIRYASVNPYWNLPPDLARLRAAPGALKGGAAFFKAKRFEVLSGWDADARVVPPMSVDWQAVEDGRLEVRVRQLPGPGNAMGRVKFMFPNELGVYLHDTPEKALMTEEARLFSSGCVRVEDAPRLARWLFGRPLSTKGAKPEQRVDLPQPVPVYLTYLTAAPENGRLVFREDVYGRDTGERLARR
jgi:L,D-transpeptidase YcbB